MFVFHHCFYSSVYRPYGLYFIQQCLQPETNIVLVHHFQASFNTGHLTFQVGHLPGTEMEIANNVQYIVGWL